MSQPLPAGAVIASRFAIERAAGSGGMGTIYRTLDLHQGTAVALKLLHDRTTPGEIERFDREATLLADLRHPGIVSYVAHGRTEAGQLFLAMEWLDGEDLSHRLLHQPLYISEAIQLLRRAAEALAVAHVRGVIHRDIKPSNLFLRDRRADLVTLLDFGVARQLLPMRAVTRSGVLLGTVKIIRSAHR